MGLVMGYTTPKEYIAYLKKNYQNNMNQPIVVFHDDKESVRELIYNVFDDVFLRPDTIPDVLLEKCLSNLSDDDRVAEAISDSYKFDVKEYITEYMQNQDDKELWEQ